MSKNFIFAFVFLLFISQIASAQKSTPTPARTVDIALRGPLPPETNLTERIQYALNGFSGHVWIYAKNLDTGTEYSLRGDEQVRTASTIKLAIMAETFHQVAQGKLHWNDEIILTKEKKQGGSGILFEFSDDTKIDLQTALHLMIVVSDNSATNLVLDKVGTDNVNVFAESLGLHQTRSLRKIGGGLEAKVLDEQPLYKNFGLGVSSPHDMVRLLEMLENGQVVSREASAEMLNILKRQQYKDGIGRGLPDTIASASKSGALDRLRSDVGIIYTRRGRIAMAITTDDMMEVSYTEENPGLKMLWKLSQILQDGLGK